MSFNVSRFIASKFLERILKGNQRTFKVNCFHCLNLPRHTRKLLVPKVTYMDNLDLSAYYSETAEPMMAETDISKVVGALEEIFPENFAASWDNTGLLVDVPKFTKVTKIFLTNDLTEPVLEEALQLGANFIYAYHPPIFEPIKSLSHSNWKHRVIMKCVSNNIAVYSAHTRSDCIVDGVSDWLLKDFDLTEKVPILPGDHGSKYDVEFFYGKDFDENKVLNNIQSAFFHKTEEMEDQSTKITMRTDSSSISTILSKLKYISSEGEIWNINSTIVDGGVGRRGKLNKPLKLGQCITKIKNYLRLPQLRIVYGNYHTLDTEIRTIACCPGSGAGVLKNIRADLYITGEMPHHDLLNAQQSGISVILCEHSNSERGYLNQLSNAIRVKLEENIPIIVSTFDRDPVTIS